MESQQQLTNIKQAIEETLELYKEQITHYFQTGKITEANIKNPSIKRTMLEFFTKLVENEPIIYIKTYEKRLQTQMEILFRNLKKEEASTRFNQCKIIAGQKYENEMKTWTNNNKYLTKQQLWNNHKIIAANIITLLDLPDDDLNDDNNLNYRHEIDKYLNGKLGILYKKIETAKGELIQNMKELYMTSINQKLLTFKSIEEFQTIYGKIKSIIIKKIDNQFKNTNNNAGPNPNNGTSSNNNTEIIELKTKCITIITELYQQDLIQLQNNLKRIALLKTKLQKVILQQISLIIKDDPQIQIPRNLALLTNQEIGILHENIVHKVKMVLGNTHKGYQYILNFDKEYIDYIFVEQLQHLTNLQNTKLNELHGQFQSVQLSLSEYYYRKLMDKVTNNNMTVKAFETYHKSIYDETLEIFKTTLIGTTASSSSKTAPTSSLVNNERLTAFAQPYLEDFSLKLREHYEKVRVMVQQGELALLIKMQQSANWYEEQMLQFFSNNSFVKPMEFLKKHETFSNQMLTKFGSGLTKIQLQALKDNLQLLFDKYAEINNKNAPVEGAAIGIDLGTTHTCVAICINGETKLIPTENYKSTVPSYVAFKQGSNEVLVGEVAKNQAHENPSGTIYNAKLLIGRKYEEVEELIQGWSFNVIESNHNPVISLRNNQVIQPEFISAKILSHIKQLAEKYCQGKPITRAVITVPAYFKNGQRQATLDAGRIAGIEVLQIINEPTAAALAYNLQHSSTLLRTIRTQDTLNVLVYDLGGGTFDVSVLTIDKFGMIQVQAVKGCNLGGEDFDQKLVDYCVEQFKSKAGVDLNPSGCRKPDSINRALRLLRNECEKQKHNLSACLSIHITIGSLYEGHDLNVEITRNDFESMNMVYFNQTLDIVNAALIDAGLNPSDINEIVMVGGSTKIPKIQSMVSTFFNGKQLMTAMNPDEIVAIGAASLAAKLNGIQSTKLQNISLIDVTPFSLGIETSDGSCSVIIKRNSSIPITKSRTYVTTHDNQTSVLINIYQGEQIELAKNNNLLGTFEVGNLPLRRKGDVRITVTMVIDEQGILQVSAYEGISEQKVELTIDERKGRLTKDEIEGLRRQLELTNISPPEESNSEEDDRSEEEEELKIGEEDSE